MSRTSRKRSTVANRAIVAGAALLLGGGGLAAVNVYASAGEGSSKSSPQTESAAVTASTISCPDPSNSLTEVPESARPEVDSELAKMDTQITNAYAQFADQKAAIAQDPGYADNAILQPLKAKRTAALNRISTAIGRAGTQPSGLEALSACTLRNDDNTTTAARGGGRGGPGGQGGRGGRGGQGGQGGQNGGAAAGGAAAAGADGGAAAAGGADAGADAGAAAAGADAGAAAAGADAGAAAGGAGGAGGGQAGNGPEASDFVDITTVAPNVKNPQIGRGGSKGTFSSECGRNEAGIFNSDNVIVAPGVTNGAHHMHDYIGNDANDAFATDESLAAAGTSCANPGDKSTYYWPVLRLQNGVDEADANVDGGGLEGNVGEIQTPAQVTNTFVGSPKAKVTAMPRLLRIITGDAKAFVNGPTNANASWSCTGFENRQLKDKYPICPEGSSVVRTFKFQSCWDGVNIDSANHRTHVAFAAANGNCPAGFKAIPQLQQRVVYDVPPGPGFAVDSFPEQLHKPVTDHGDFINVFDEKLMNQLVSCINGGRKCK
jgi:hypothetical protein